MESISWERRCYCIPFTFYVCVVPFKFASDNLDLNYPADKFKMSGQIQVIYFDVEVFNKFMDGNFELPFGILQQFIEPADDLNSQIQAFWSKSVTLFTKRVCKMSFTNKSLNIYERHCTFEGPEYFSEATQVKDFQSQRISEQIVDNQEKIAMQEVTSKGKTFIPRVYSKQIQRHEQNLNQFLNSTHLFKQVKSVKYIKIKQMPSQTLTPKQNIIQKYVNLRLRNCKSITPIKYSIEIPSTADYLSRKTKSTYQDLRSTYQFKNSRDNYNQSLQERQQNRIIEIKDEQEQ